MSEAARVDRALVEGLPAFLPNQRWFGDKWRAIASVGVVDLVETGSGAERFWLSVVDVRFCTGDGARYFVPVAERPTPGVDGRSIGALPGGAGYLVDAFDLPGFLGWAIDPLAGAASIDAANGRFAWSVLPDRDGRLDAARSAPARLSSAEQSNSSVRYGDAVFMKVFRRLRAGIDPDEEIGRFLATETPFRRFPTPLGTGRYLGADGSTCAIALAQAFVPSVADGWRYTLASLAAGADGWGFAAAARTLGERTGELHLALASGREGTAFAPEPISAADTAGWTARATEALDAVERRLVAGRDGMPASLRRTVDTFRERRGELERRAEGFGAQIGGWSTRVHGDYHLGQTLRTPDEDWVILDFEGEPAKTIEERRRKTSPLKDVAGMLRSLGYARGAALRAVPEAERDDRLTDRLDEWETATRSAFLAGYRSAVGGGPVSPVPEDERALSAALAAWELDKALYEVLYELANRPDWLALPLGSLLAPRREVDANGEPRSR